MSHVRALLIALEDWAMDEPSTFLGLAKLTLILLALFAPFIALAVIAGQNEENACLRCGGAWTRTGVTHGMVWTGKVMVPTTVQHYGCIMPMYAPPAPGGERGAGGQ